MPSAFLRLPPRYLFRDRLGRGGQGEVFLVEDLALARMCALKVLDADSGEARAALESEFEALAALRHPHLVPPLDYGRLPDGRPYLAYEYLRGGSLSRERLPLPAGRRDAWMAQLLGALEFLHVRGLVHLDIKPQNLLLRAPSGPVETPPLHLADFGLLGRAGERARRMGTPGYTAPEILAHGAVAYPRADFYSVGVLAYEFTTGHSCFPASTPEGRLELQQAGDWDRRAVARDPAFAALLELLLSPHPDLRPADVAAVRRRFPSWAAADGQPSDAAAALPPPRGRDAELQRVIDAATSSPARDVRILGPGGSGLSSMLRAAEARLASRSGLRVFLHQPAVHDDLRRALDSLPELDLLLVDDLHRLHEKQFEVLRRWKRARPSRAIVGAADEALLSGAARGALRRLLPASVVVRLSPLSPEACAEIVRATLSGPEGVERAALLAEAAGHQPGPLITLCRALREREATASAPDADEAGRDASGSDSHLLEILSRAPDSDPLAARLAIEPPEAQRFLWVAAWLGEEAAREQLAAFQAPPCPAICPPLSRAEPRAWLGDPRRLVRALSAVVPESDRRALAGVCLGVATGLEPRARAELAECAGLPEVTRTALLEACERESDPALWRRLLEHLPADPSGWPLFDRALDALHALGGDPAEEGAVERRLAGPLDPGRRAELLRRQAWAALLRGAVEEAGRLQEEALAQAGGHPLVRAAILVDRGWRRAAAADSDGALRDYEEGLSLATGQDDQWALSCRLETRLGILAWQRGDGARGETLLRSAIERARAAGNLAAECAAWTNLCPLLQDAGCLNEIVRLGEDLLRRCQEAPTDRRVPLAELHNRLAVAWRYQGRFDRAAAEAREALAHAEGSGERMYLHRYLLSLAQDECGLARWTEAEALLDEVANGAALGEDRSFAVALRGQILRGRGDVAGAARRLTRACSYRQHRGKRALAAALLRSVLRLGVEAEDARILRHWMPQAELLLRGGLPPRVRLGLKEGWLSARLALEGPSSELSAQTDELLSEARSTELGEVIFRARLLEGWVALAQGDPARAEQSLAAAAEQLGKTDAPIESTELLELRAAWMAVVGRPEEAGSALEEARRRYHTLGLRHCARRISRWQQQDPASRAAWSGALWARRQAGASATLGETGSLAHAKGQPGSLAAQGLPSSAAVQGFQGSQPSLPAQSSARFLLEVGRLLHALDSLDKLVEEGLGILLETIPAERGALFLCDLETRQLGLAAARGGRQALASTALQASEAILRSVADSGQTVFMGEEPSPAPSEGAASDRGSILCQPFFLEDVVIGVIYLDHAEPGAFSSWHRELLRGFGRLLAVAIDQARTRARLAQAEERARRENQHIRRSIHAGRRAEIFVCHSPQMRGFLESVSRVAPFPTTVLLLGESGTGKECIAHMIHGESPRADRVFLGFDCAAVAPGLMDAEIFGMETGRATGVQSSVGLFETADGGTLFLDEIGDMDLGLQAKLLRVLQNGEVRRVGSQRPFHVDVRVVAATNRDLLEMVRAGRFREDLYFRLSAVTLRLPPLRERPDDILPLAEHFLQMFSTSMEKPVPAMAPAFRAALLEHRWPGNVRELRNEIERALVLQPGPLLTVPPRAGGLDAEPRAAAPSGGEREDELLLRTLAVCGWNQSRAAGKLGLTEGAVRYRMKALGISRPTDIPRSAGRRPRSPASS